MPKKEGKKGGKGGGEGSKPDAPPTRAEIFQALENREFKLALKLAPIAYGHWWSNLARENTAHVVVETFLCMFIVWLLLRKAPKKGPSTDLTKDEVDQLVEEWKPAPLVPKLTEQEQHLSDSMLVIEEFDGHKVKLMYEQKPKLNFVTFDFLGMSLRDELKDGAKDTLNEYGCGSCGPRGFYGSVMPHIEIENNVKAFMGTEGAISYSDSASAVSSTLPAFAKKGDLLIIDSSVHEPIGIGADLSRSKIMYYDHNDMESLEAVLKKVASDDKRLGRNKLKQRRFIVTEALFRNTGELVDLRTLVALKKKYGYRLILDESFSFGAIGATGRGLTEHAGVPVTDVDIMVVSMAYSLGSIGGLSLGNVEVADHQRLSGAGYCFSASAPPFVSTAASKALACLESQPSLMKTLQANVTTVRTAVASTCGSMLGLVSDPASPIIHLNLAGEAAATFPDRATQIAVLEATVQGCKQMDLLITTAKTLKGEKTKDGKEPLVPTLRLAVRASMDEKMLRTAVETIKKALTIAMKYYKEKQ